MRIRITQKTQENPKGYLLELDCRVVQQIGDDLQISDMLFEAEQSGNAGKARVHYMD